MNRLFSTYENLVKIFQFGNLKSKSRSVNQIEVVDLESFLQKYERRLYQFQNVVFWESPLLSAAITLTLTLLFYFLSYCSWKLFASLFSLLLVLCVGEVWVDRIWPEIAVETPTSDDWLPVNERALSAAEIGEQVSRMKKTMDHFWKWLLNLRREKPTIFCLSTSCTLFALIFTTWCISGTTLVYLTLLSVLCGPALARKAAKSPLVQDNVRGLINLFSVYLAELKEEEEDKMLPHVTEESKKYLELDCASPAKDSVDSIHSLAQLGVTSMPSYEDVCLNRSNGDEFALPHREPAVLPGVDLYTPPLSSVSNTSSSASLVSDAPDNDDMEYSSTPTSTSHMAAAGGGLRQRRHLSSADEDSEFEMIEHEDVNSKS